MGNKYSEAQKKASQKYIGGLDEFKLRLPKGEKEAIKAHADSMGESVNGFIYRAIKEAIERDQSRKSE